MHPDASSAHDPPAAGTPDDPPRRRRPFRLRIRWRPESGELHVRLGRATAAALAAALLCTTIASLARLTSPRGEAVDELQLASSIDPFDGAGGPTEPSLLIRVEDPPRASVGRSNAAVATRARSTAADTPRPPATTVRRVVGLNYLVLGTIPSRRDAERRRDELARHGIVVTVEPALSGWSRGGYALVGVRGFDLGRDDAALARQLAELRTLKIQAVPYKWRAHALASTS
jgi:hypothetical protein